MAININKNKGVLASLRLVAKHASTSLDVDSQLMYASPESGICIIGNAIPAA